MAVSYALMLSFFAEVIQITLGIARILLVFKLDLRKGFDRFYFNVFNEF